MCEWRIAADSACRNGKEIPAVPHRNRRRWTYGRKKYSPPADEAWTQSMLEPRWKTAWSRLPTTDDRCRCCRPEHAHHQIGIGRPCRQDHAPFGPIQQALRSAQLSKKTVRMAVSSGEGWSTNTSGNCWNANRRQNTPGVGRVGSNPGSWHHLSRKNVCAIDQNRASFVCTNEAPWKPEFRSGDTPTTALPNTLNLQPRLMTFYQWVREAHTRVIALVKCLARGIYTSRVPSVRWKVGQGCRYRTNDNLAYCFWFWAFKRN